jgi:DNA-binding TFAR19-related protein (PDSD5 family)
MNFKSKIKYYLLGESIKEIEMNRILDKISKKLNLSTREKKFLYLYNYTKNEDNRDFMLLSKNMVVKKVTDLLKKDKTIICDLTDRNGKIGLKIENINNNIENDFCKIVMKNGITHNIYDRYLYNIIYNLKRDQYSLQEHDEYYEKIEANND